MEAFECLKVIIRIRNLVVWLLFVDVGPMFVVLFGMCLGVWLVEFLVLACSTLSTSSCSFGLVFFRGDLHLLISRCLLLFVEGDSNSEF